VRTVVPTRVVVVIVDRTCCVSSTNTGQPESTEMKTGPPYSDGGSSMDFVHVEPEATNFSKFQNLVSFRPSNTCPNFSLLKSVH
jgi:hypothetical protein